MSTWNSPITVGLLSADRVKNDGFKQERKAASLIQTELVHTQVNGDTDQSPFHSTIYDCVLPVEPRVTLRIIKSILCR